MERFVYNHATEGRQPLLAPAVRSNTLDTTVFIRHPNAVVVVFDFLDVPDVPNRVTPRFLLSDGAPFLEGLPVEGPGVQQLYVLGHGQAVPSGMSGKITGMLEGMGEGQDQMVDLDITIADPWERYGVTRHFPFVPPEFVLRMLHDGAAPITYEATINVGPFGG